MALEFMKLEKIEFGGIKGKMLSSQVIQVFDEFNELYKLFTERTYDSLDPSDPAFMEDYDNFNAAIGDLDRRLATIVCQGFDDCSGPESCFRVIVIFPFFCLSSYEIFSINQLIEGANNHVGHNFAVSL